jgi:hypothetical protein
MAASLGRYVITSPATSRELREHLDAAINEGSRTAGLALSDLDTHETLQIEFTLVQARYRDMSAEYIGKLPDQGAATITAMTHPDLSDTPARLTLVRRPTP